MKSVILSKKKTQVSREELKPELVRSPENLVSAQNKYSINDSFRGGNHES